VTRTRGIPPSDRHHAGVNLCISVGILAGVGIR
jgi:hypothetical protein